MPYLQHLRPDHDEGLIVRLAAADVSGREADEARRLVATCPACAELLADIQAISAATAALPAPRRPRDLRLTEADAARLRPSGWRGWLARFGGQGYAFTKPLATGLAALGVAGLLLAAVPGGLTGLGSSGAAESARNAAEAPITDQALGVAPSTVPGDVQASMAPVGPTAVGPEAGAAASPPVPAKGAVPDASAAAAASAPPAGAPGTPGATGGYGATASGPTTGTTGAGNLAPSGSGTGTAGVLNPPQATPAPSPSPLVLVSVVLLAAGIGLGLLRWAARRAR